jgi:hypothetical protein
MIVDNFYLLRVAITPYKTNPPLVVDPDRVLTLPVAVKRVQLIACGTIRSLRLLA